MVDFQKIRNKKEGRKTMERVIRKIKTYSGYEIRSPGEYKDHNDWTVDYYTVNREGKINGFFSQRFHSRDEAINYAKINLE